MDVSEPLAIAARTAAAWHIKLMATRREKIIAKIAKVNQKAANAISKIPPSSTGMFGGDAAQLEKVVKLSRDLGVGSRQTVQPFQGSSTTFTPNKRGGGNPKGGGYGGYQPRGGGVGGYQPRGGSNVKLRGGRGSKNNSIETIVVPLLPSTDNLVIKEVKLPPQEDFISGALPKFIDNWKLITTDPVTLDAVTGLTIPFKYLPPCRLPTQGELSSKDVDPVVDAAVAELLVLKAAVIVADNTEGFYSRVFTVPKVERGVEYARRFIINLKVRFIIWTLVSQSHNFI